MGRQCTMFKRYRWKSWFKKSSNRMEGNSFTKSLKCNYDFLLNIPSAKDINRCGYSILKRSVKLTRFKSFPLQLSGHQDIPLLSFVRVASSTLLRCGWVFISARLFENCISVERLNTLNTDLQSLLQNIKKFAAG